MPINETLILDTHVWLWVLLGDPRIRSASVSKHLVSAATSGHLCISAISVWEVAMLESKGRISFSMDISAWMETALSMPGLQLIPLSPAIALKSTRLPGSFHGDPADRIIAATARDCNGTLVTADRQIIEYAQNAGHIKLLAVE